MVSFPPLAGQVQIIINSASKGIAQPGFQQIACLLQQIIRFNSN
jgi:hypothetical protein